MSDRSTTGLGRVWRSRGSIGGVRWTPRTELRLAWTAFLNGDPSRGEIPRRPRSQGAPEVSGHLLAGRLLVEDGRWQEAAGAYSRVVELDPADPAGYLGLGTVLGSSGRVADALDVFTRGLARSGLARAAIQPGSLARPSRRL